MITAWSADVATGVGGSLPCIERVAKLRTGTMFRAPTCPKIFICPKIH